MDFYRIRYHQLIFLYICLLFHLSTVIAAEVKKVEEGWRYHANFQLNVKLTQDPPLEKSIDLSPMHCAMAQVIWPSSSKQKYTCMFRFTPIIATKDEMKIGEPVRLTDGAILCTSIESLRHLPVYELGFMSGFCEPGKGELAAHITSLGLKLPNRDEKANVFGIMPPYEKKEPFSYIALRFLQRVHIDPELFENRVQYRYPDDLDKTCFSTGNYQPIKLAHDVTKERMRDRAKVIEKSFAEMAQRALVMNLDEAMAPNRKILEDKAGVIKSFNNNPHVNSYTCAEQAGLDFLSDERIVTYLHTYLDLDNPDVKALLVNLHCSHTPCSLCATSLARESEEGGIFKIIAKGKPVFLFCSCQNQYERKEPMILYPETTFLDNATLSLDKTKLDGQITAPSIFNIDEEKALLPFPIVLMRFTPQTNIHGAFDIDDMLLKKMLSVSHK